MTRPTILSIGDIVFDILATVIFPIQAERVIMTDYPLLEPGGACNFAITAARLGAVCQIVGACGADVWGDMIVGILRAEGVDVSMIRQFPAMATTLVMALSDPAAFQQSYISSRVGGSDVYPADDPAALAALDGAQALYVQGYTLAEEYIWPITRRLMSAAVGRIPIYFDPSPLLKNASFDRQEFALTNADVLFATENELDGIPAEMFDRPNLIRVIKRGGDGCRISAADGDRDFPAYPVQAIGSVAAGDAFNAAFISARLRGFSLDDAARIGNATGAAKVQRMGGGRNVPHLADVQRILSANRVPITLDDWRV